MFKHMIGCNTGVGAAADFGYIYTSHIPAEFTADVGRDAAWFDSLCIKADAVEGLH